MTAFVDTNVLIRHFTGDPPEMAARATKFLALEPELLLTDVVVAEAVFVLESYYEAPRAQIADLMRALLVYDGLLVVDLGVLLRALELYETTKVHFADGYLIACAESTGVGRVASFDLGIDRVKTVERVEPGS